ncbi:MAG: hypothetical protein IH793_12085 [Acidobacteria bacterium]|nr:hypothetical protein [Acidobacteriota bacterium]
MSEPPDADPINYEGPFIIVCEGLSDSNFLSKLLEHHNMNGFDPVRSRVASGKDGYPTLLKAVSTHRNFRTLRGIVVTIDNDDNPQEAFRLAREALVANGLPIPEAPLEIAREGVSVGVLPIPGAHTNGTLDSLLLEAVLENQPDLRECIRNYKECVGYPNGWSVSKQAKMQLRALIAGCCEEDPHISLSWVWGKRGNPIPIGSPRFLEIVGFLRQISD